MARKKQTKSQDECICGWRGENFQIHLAEHQFDDWTHVETSPMMRMFLRK